jgi:hypothetical protein
VRRIEGTSRLDYSENDGSFRFNNVPAGPVTIIVNYTGYESVRETFTTIAFNAATDEFRCVRDQGFGAEDPVTFLAFWLLNSSPAFLRVSSFPRPNLILVVNFRRSRLLRHPRFTLSSARCEAPVRITRQIECCCRHVLQHRGRLLTDIHGLSLHQHYAGQFDNISHNCSTAQP